MEMLISGQPTIGVFLCGLTSSDKTIATELLHVYNISGDMDGKRRKCYFHAW
jgi:hypothetical protein